jgi:hypothetical protein
MKRLLAFGVDGLSTDRPDLLCTLLEEKSMAVPPHPQGWS